MEPGNDLQFSYNTISKCHHVRKLINCRYTIAHVVFVHAGFNLSDPNTDIKMQNGWCICHKSCTQLLLSYMTRYQLDLELHQTTTDLERIPFNRQSRHLSTHARQQHNV